MYVPCARRAVREDDIHGSCTRRTSIHGVRGYAPIDDSVHTGTNLATATTTSAVSQAVGVASISSKQASAHSSRALALGGASTSCASAATGDALDAMVVVRGQRLHMYAADAAAAAARQVAFGQR